MSQHPEANPGGSPSTELANPSDDQRQLAADASRNSETESQPVILSETQSVLPTVQAAQLEHKSGDTPISDSNCALAGGEKSPQTPLQISPPKAAKKSNGTRRKKRRDNHISFRASDAESDIVAERMARTGETQSDAVRAIIRESQDKTGNVHLAPKTPPEQLEKLLGELQKWRMAFSTAKPRLNIATPANDDARYAEVVKWRQENARLLAEIPKLEELVNVALGNLTCLTPERVAMLKIGHPSLVKWEQSYRAKKKEDAANVIQTIIEMIEDAGIKPEAQK